MRRSREPGCQHQRQVPSKGHAGAHHHTHWEAVQSRYPQLQSRLRLILVKHPGVCQRSLRALLFKSERDTCPQGQKKREENPRIQVKITTWGTGFCRSTDHRYKNIPLSAQLIKNFWKFTELMVDINDLKNCTKRAHNCNNLCKFVCKARKQCIISLWITFLWGRSIDIDYATDNIFLKQ